MTSTRQASHLQRLRQLCAQHAELRTENAILKEELAAARKLSGAELQADLVEANGKLVVAALHSEEAVETVTGELGELVRASQRDALTGMPNRGLLMDRLESAIALSRRRGTRLAVLFLDLDGFKKVNDLLGHAAGDEVLQLVARRLESALRDSDTVSRHSGDEFVVLLADVIRVADAGLTATKLLAAIAEPSCIAKTTIRLSASIGTAVFPEDGGDAMTLIHRADSAMYRAKRRSDGGLASYDRVLDTLAG